MPDSDNLDPLFDTLLEHVPPPAGDPEAPLRALVTNLDASSFLGRIALCRIHAGRMRKGQTVGWCREDGSVTNVTHHRAAAHRGPRPGPRHPRRGR